MNGSWDEWTPTQNSNHGSKGQSQNGCHGRLSPITKKIRVAPSQASCFQMDLSCRGKGDALWAFHLSLKWSRRKQGLALSFGKGMIRGINKLISGNLIISTMVILPVLYMSLGCLWKKKSEFCFQKRANAVWWLECWTRTYETLVQISTECPGSATFSQGQLTHSCL